MHYFVREGLMVRIWTEIIDCATTGWKKAVRLKGGVNPKLSQRQCHAAASLWHQRHGCEQPHHTTPQLQELSRLLPPLQQRSRRQPWAHLEEMQREATDWSSKRCGRNKKWLVQGNWKNRSDFSLKQRQMTGNTSPSHRQKVAAKRNGVIVLSVSRLSSNS